MLNLVHFTCFFSLFWAKLLNLKEIFVYLNQIAFFILVYFPDLPATLFALYSKFATGLDPPEPLVKSKPAQFFIRETHTFSNRVKSSVDHFSSSDACA